MTIGKRKPNFDQVITKENNTEVIDGEVCQKNSKNYQILDPSEFDITSEEASGILKFHIPSKSQGDEELTRVTVVDEDENLTDINFSEIQKIIRENKRIKKIVIEHVKVNEVGKLQLLFSKKDEGDKPLIECINDKHQKTLIDIEAKINRDIFGRSRKEVEQIILKKEEKFIEDIQNGQKISIDQEEIFRKLDMKSCEQDEVINKTKTQRRQERIQERHDQYEKQSIKDSSPQTVQDERSENMEDLEDIIEEVIEDIKPTETITEAPNLSLKNSAAPIHHDDPAEYRNIDLKRDTLIRRNRKTQIAKFYYRAQNHAELFELGKSFLHDYENGITNFSFFGNNICTPKQKAIFGVAAFLNYQSNVNITIVTQTIEGSIYKELLPKLKVEEKFIEKENIYYNVYIGDGVEIIEFEELFNVYSALNVMHFDEFLEELHQHSDITIWDLPEMEHIIDYNELFLPIIDVIDNVSLMVKSGLTRTDDIQKQLDFFKTYHIRIKGIIFDKNKLSTEKIKKKLSQERNHE